MFQEYEKALVGNDVEALNALFRDDPRTIRRLRPKTLRHPEIKSFRGSAFAGSASGALLVQNRDHNLWPRLRGGGDVVRAAFGSLAGAVGR